MRIELTAEAKLEGMIRERVATLKAQYDCWRDPEQLCKAMGIRVEYGRIGMGREGAAFADAIQVDPNAGVLARRRFTFYHEIVHHVVRNHDELYSIISDQYQADGAFRAIQERLCNVGAAEFLLPRADVQAAYREHGFSVGLISLLSQ
ncbi:MAG TPA: ImmA/IrrE family metallo-endopeptidase, partial [Ktedonobacterales bacterium]|nr:ImmA/IrrE family metallo-endopeptidase [Ktedonobacterales bacterium]